MSISSSLAHKYDEFDEFSQPSAPKSAYEELKAWCEKHLDADEYRIVEKTSSYLTTIYFIDKQCNEATGMIYFFRCGEVAGISNYTEDEMIEHINEVEYEEKRRGLCK